MPTSPRPARWPCSAGAEIAIGLATLIEYSREIERPSESFTLTLNGYDPTAVGVPEMTPFDPPSERPGGSAPLATEKLIVPAGVTVRVAEYDAPTVPGGTEAGSRSRPGNTLKVNSFCVARSSAHHEIPP